MPANDNMIPAWFRNAEASLSGLRIPEEVQGALMLPFLSDKMRTSVIGQELREKVLKELKMTPAEYCRRFLDIKKEAGESFVTQGERKGWLQAKDLAELAANFEESRGATSYHDTMAKELLHAQQGRESERHLIGGECEVVRGSPEQEGAFVRGNVEPVAHTSAGDAARHAVGEEPSKDAKGDACCEVNVGPRDQKGVDQSSEVTERKEVESQSDDREEMVSIARMDTAGDPLQGVVRRDDSRAAARFPELLLEEFVSGKRTTVEDSQNSQAVAAVQAMWPQQQKSRSGVRSGISGYVRRQ
ncbi:hypothetical protein HPB52_017236 [Rhipicephalus sanguineus]|uniref:Uncharacterized protein n=1 Tax=Rhipicephalus sanguineus TaxID=34632 RepID=A0A9D4PWV0_RHISA|nr:hypothetical protein HPB52_017236 [Rhipicephalus sanguineus]